MVSPCKHFEIDIRRTRASLSRNDLGEAQMASVYWWTNTGTGDFAATWALVSGPGNTSGTPSAPGDTAIVPVGTVVNALDMQLTAATIEAGATTPVSAEIFTGDSFVTSANPSYGSATLFDMTVSGQATAETLTRHALTHRAPGGRGPSPSPSEERSE
jgi:hypothetical protein